MCNPAGSPRTRLRERRWVLSCLPTCFLTQVSVQGPPTSSQILAFRLNSCQACPWFFHPLRDETVLS